MTSMKSSSSRKPFTSLSGEDDIAAFEKLMDMLNEVDDVQNVYHNVEQ